MQEKRFKTEQRKRLKLEIKNIEKVLVEKLEKAFRSGAYPPHWEEEGNCLLAISVIHSLCLEQPYKALDKQHIKDQEKLHLFI
ncbi:MAG: hypothetical protein IPO78_17240 [Saprospiraceae bacterium]|nr:hypothetical protein [Saprospiraceae bacterium]